MKAVLLLIALATADTCTSARQTEAAGGMDVEMNTIARGGYAADESGRNAVLARSDAEYRRLWSELVGEAQAPDADFDTSVVVFLFAGMRNTGGWTVEPESVRVEDGTAVITARVKGPAPGAIVTQALTYPYAVVAVRDRSVEKVHWPE